MALRNVISVDDRLMYANSVQTIKEGANQVSSRRINATQTNSSLIEFSNLLSIGEASIIDPAVYISYNITIQGSANNGDIITPAGVQTTVDAGAPSVWARATPATTTATKVDTATLINNPNLIFSQCPLSSVCNNLSVSINNVNSSVNLANVVGVMRENLLSEKQRNQIATMCPCDLNRSPLLYPQYTVASPYGVNNQPNTSVEDSNQRSRICVKLVSVAGRTCVYTITEPVFCSPFSVSSSHGIVNVNSLSVRYQLDSSNALLGMVNSSQDCVNANLNATTISISDAFLLINYLSIDVLSHPIPPIGYYEYNGLEVNLKEFTADFSGANMLVNTNAFKLTTIPAFYWVKAMPSVVGVGAKNLLCGFPITNLQITYGSYGIYIFDQEQLWLCYQRNTGNTGVSFRQWVALGTPVCLAGTDMSSAGAYPGISGIGGVMWSVNVQCNAQNYVDVGLNQITAQVGSTFITEIFQMQGSLSVGGGSAVYKTSTIDMATFDELTQHAVVSDGAVLASQSGTDGAGFNWSGVRSLLSAGTKKLGQLAVQHGPELAKTAAKMGLDKLQEHLEGSGIGESAGRFSRRR